MFIGCMLCSRHWEYKCERESLCPSKAGSDGETGGITLISIKRFSGKILKDISASSGGGVT